MIDFVYNHDILHYELKHSSPNQSMMTVFADLLLDLFVFADKVR